ncbi:hypothetical protein H6P81_003470 [Aristolochia fimbriata]|uniref:Uncharacterized protein n=1 Tax=Aristolochia fimbriata TaxID=158543 RepID=A0AAV7FCN1_ARIFI|nr:hypothetical protein H6P81_003470 [Aristolochia fimbriata]
MNLADWRSRDHKVTNTTGQVYCAEDLMAKARKTCNWMIIYVFYGGCCEAVGNLTPIESKFKAESATQVKEICITAV